MGADEDALTADISALASPLSLPPDQVPAARGRLGGEREAG
jgi:hypothetical protein